MVIRTSIDLAMKPSAAFEVMVEELSAALVMLGMKLEPGPSGQIVEDEFQVGNILSWEPGRRVVLKWRAANWKPKEVTRVELRFEPTENGTRVTLEHEGLSSLLGEESDELAGWFAREVAAPFLQASAPKRFGDWFTDRRARRPTGAQARATYRDPLHHRPNFKAILRTLSLTREDYLLEVGCGGGALLEEALRSGCKAAAIDHSPDMVNLAREVNQDAIKEGRLEVCEAEADQLPFPESKFTCATMTGVFGFIPDPTAALSEVFRVLAKGGRFVMFTGSKELQGTIAAPEPMASRIHFYEDAELKQLALKVGFAEAWVERPELLTYAKEVGVPDAHLSFSSKMSGQLLVARKAKSMNAAPMG